jgi:Protein of unknown function (DUF2950)
MQAQLHREETDVPMREPVMKQRSKPGGMPRIRAFSAVQQTLLLAVLVVSIGCGKQEQPAPSGPKTFASPAAAASSLYDATKSGDTAALLSIFGSDAKDYLFSGDADQDKAATAAFLSDYDKMHRWGKIENGGLVLNVGIENYPFPFPLLKNTSGQWYFDSEAAKKEFIARRIGDNELTVIDILNAMADAQSEYFLQPQLGSKVNQYARKFTSSEGKHDGLYWSAGENDLKSPLGPLAARANAEGYKKGSAEAPAPYHGYFFHILTEQGPNAPGGARKYIVKDNMTGGFAFIAFPAEYRVTGVMTILINQDGEMFEKDLGPETTVSANSMTSFDPDDSWVPVE